MKYHALMFSANYYPTSRNTGNHRIATVLRDEGWDVEVIDFAAHWPLETLKELVKSRVTSQTKFFGFSSFFNCWTDSLTNLTTWMKKEYPQIKIILGGQAIALTKAPSKNIDYWIDSFGDIAILEVIKSIIGNTPSGLKFDFENFGDKKLIKSIKSYPAFPLQSYKNILEKRDFVKSYEWLTTEFSRGCKFSCSFCNFPILGVKGDYSRTQDDFEYEMKYNYDNFGVKNYYIADETFNDTTEKINKFADVTDRLNFKTYFSGFLRADLLVSHKESWDSLIKLGVGGHYYGIETFNHQSAKIIKKGMNPDKLKEGLLEIKKYFSDRIYYRGSLGLIVGLPHETIQTISETKDWVENNWYDENMTVWPLGLSDMKVGEHFTNLSDFSKNLMKYGLREMKDFDNQIKILEQSGGKYDLSLAPSYGESSFNWEHDTMNEVQANYISQKLNAMKSCDIVGNFTMSNVGILLGRDFHNMNEVDNFRQSDFENIIYYHKMREFVKDYIQNKMNMV